MSSVLPNFFILGAPKCGTTSLARWLEGHPQVFFSPVKEPHFFNTDLSIRNITSDFDYRRLFDRAGPEHIAVGEASTWYLFSETAVPSILDLIPEARFIVMTRNPVEMARSLHHHNLRVLHENEPDFARAWSLQEARSNGWSIPRGCTEPALLQYGAVCSLGAQVERLLCRIPVDRVLHIPLDGLRDSPAHHYRRALAFLGVPDDLRQMFSLENPARSHRSRTLQRVLRLGARLRFFLGVRQGLGLGRLNEKPQGKAPLDYKLRSKLEKYFAGDLEILRRALARLPDHTDTL